ncbi:hypothetical protein PR048_017591 [Dryococelus australis]|uniref:Uncharacterized protein n=1 Tax=Dryococelus australis TaxID=614101 RepID=A0ABQ9H9Z1_9NEOP|nr:hypothetical protein PR048_017591 [Dryococelus australis]
MLRKWVSCRAGFMVCRLLGQGRQFGSGYGSKRARRTEAGPVADLPPEYRPQEGVPWPPIPKFFCKQSSESLTKPVTTFHLKQLKTRSRDFICHTCTRKRYCIAPLVTPASINSREEAPRAIQREWKRRGRKNAWSRESSPFYLRVHLCPRRRRVCSPSVFARIPQEDKRLMLIQENISAISRPGEQSIHGPGFWECFPLLDVVSGHKPIGILIMFFHKESPPKVCNISYETLCIIRNSLFKIVHLASCNSDILRADEGEVRAVWSSVRGMQGRGKLEMSEKIGRLEAPSGTIPTCEKSGSGPSSDHYTTLAGPPLLVSAYNPSTVTSAFSEALLKFYFQDIPPLHFSPPTKVNRARFSAGSTPGISMWKSYRTMPLVNGFSRRSPVSSAPSFRRCYILTSLHPNRLSRPQCSRGIWLPAFLEGGIDPEESSQET